MSMLTIRLDDDIAEKLSQASESERVRWEEAFNLWWRVYFISDPKQKLSTVTAYFRNKAQERGMTQKDIDEIVSDETE